MTLQVHMNLKEVSCTYSISLRKSLACTGNSSGSWVSWHGMTHYGLAEHTWCSYHHHGWRCQNFPSNIHHFFFCATGTSGNCSDVSVKIFSGVMLTNAETLLSHVRSTPRYHTWIIKRGLSQPRSSAWWPSLSVTPPPSLSHGRRTIPALKEQCEWGWCLPWY